LKALELDDTLAEAYYALAYIKEFIDWDWPGTEAAFRRAIALNPNFPDARAGYGNYLGLMKRPAESRAEIRHAVELDPFNAFFQALSSFDLLFARQYDEAVAEARTILRTVPNPVALTALWWALSVKGLEHEAFAAAKAYVNATYDDRTVEAALDRGYARGGYREAMRSGARALAARFRTTYGTPADPACLYVAAGDHAEALDWLERAFDVRDPQVPTIGTPFFDSLRSEPRYQSLLRRIGLPQ
jgi:tetratricopeptide (TPR) repeat protein